MTKRLTFRRVKELCGLNPEFEIRTAEDVEVALAHWRKALVVARQSDNYENAVLLSQCKQYLKRKLHSNQHRHCPVCGKAKALNSERCHICAYVARYRPNQLTSHSIDMKEHEIETGLYTVPGRRQQTGPLANACRALATSGKIGDSFVTDRRPEDAHRAAKAFGIQVTVRRMNPEEKVLQNRRWRVWRSDGLSAEKLNEKIQERMREAGSLAPGSK